MITPRSLELLEPTGSIETILAEGHTIHRTRFYAAWELIAELEFGRAHPRYHLTVIPQARTEALLTEALARHGLHAERGVRFETLTQHDVEVTATLVHADDNRETARASILLGADGAHSSVREALGIEFEGSAFPEPWPLYDIRLNDPLDFETAHVSFVKGGLVFLLGLKPGLWRLFGNVPDPSTTSHLGRCAAMSIGNPHSMSAIAWPRGRSQAASCWRAMPPIFIHRLRRAA